MSNDYFDSADFTAPVANSRARASQIIAALGAVERGFDRLPAPSEIGEYVTDSGAADAYVVTLSPVPTAYSAGMSFRFKATNANTGVSTVNVNSLGAKTIKKRATEDLAADDIVVGQVVEVVYDGTYFQMTSMPGTAGNTVQDAAGSASEAAASAAAALASEIDAEAAAAQVNSVLYKWCGTAGGTANALTLTPAAALTTYQSGNRLTFIASANNTGAATINVSALGAKDIKRSNGDALVVGDILSGSMYTIVYDGTNFRLSEGDRDLSAVAAPDTFTGDGSDTTFTLTYDPGTENAIDVFLDGVYQEKSTFSISGTTLTFSVAPPNGVGIEVVYRANLEATNIPADGSVTTAKLDDEAVTTDKIADGAVTSDKLAAGISFFIPVSTKSATYNLLAADLGTEIRFDTAATTLNLLAAATAGNGGIVIVSNDAASGDVTIDPNGTETLDGQSTRLLRPGDRVTIRCDGSNWQTIGGSYSFESAETSFALSSVFPFNHGLGIIPNRVELFYRCKVANNGAEVGDEIPSDPYSLLGSSYGANMTRSATQVVITTQQTYVPVIRTKTNTAITPSTTNFKLVVRAWDDH